MSLFGYMNKNILENFSIKTNFIFLIKQFSKMLMIYIQTGLISFMSHDTLFIFITQFEVSEFFLFKTQLK